jgi:hypothetical protein
VWTSAARRQARGQFDDRDVGAAAARGPYALRIAQGEVDFIAPVRFAARLSDY